MESKESANGCCSSSHVQLVSPVLCCGVYVLQALFTHLCLHSSIHSPRICTKSLPVHEIMGTGLLGPITCLGMLLAKAVSCMLRPNHAEADSAGHSKPQTPVVL